MRRHAVVLTMLLMIASTGLAQESLKRLSLDDIVNNSWKIMNRITASGSDIQYTEEDIRLIEHFKQQAIKLHDSKKIHLSKEKSAYLLAGKAINKLGSIVQSMKSSKDLNTFVTKLIRIGRGYFPGRQISNQEAVTTAIIIDCYKKL